MKAARIDDLDETDVGSKKYPSPEIAPDRGVIDKPLRLKVWEIDDPFKCPVVGWCLDMGEQREILRKEKICVKGKSDFEAHTRLVGSLQGENHISRRLDLWLSRKYRKELKELSGLREGEFLRHWEARFDRGEVEGILWVAVTKGDLSVEARQRIFGDVHMEMHVRAAEIGKERQKLDYEQERSHMLDQRLKEVNKVKRFLSKKNERLEKKISGLCQVSALLEKEKSELEGALIKLRGESIAESMRAENHELKAETKRLSQKIKNYQKQVKTIQNQNNKLSSKLEIEREINDLLRKELERINTQIPALNRPEEMYSPFDLQQKRLLIVGGIGKMEALYRQLIEENGGIFEYHDGHMKGGTKGLENQLKRAALVLCLNNHNSHGASLAVKRFGKKYRKPFRMLDNSSLSAIFQTLLEYQEGEST